MKRKAVIIVSVLTLCFVASGFGADDQPKRVMNFIAVMDLKCGKEIEKEQCGALTDVLIDELVKLKKYTVIDRANRDKILSEAGFQQTGCVDESCTIEMGRQLGVGKLVVGSITKLDETYLVNLQLLNVESAAVENSARETCDKCKLNDLIISVANVTKNLMGITPTTAPPQTSPSPTPQPPPTPSTPPPSGAIETSKIANSGIFSSYNPAKAMVIFYMPKEGRWGTIKIFDGNQLIVGLKDGAYFCYETEPGLHNFGALSRNNGAWIQLVAGKTIFLEYEVFQAMGGKPLVLIAPDKGLVAVKGLKLVGAKNAE